MTSLLEIKDKVTAVLRQEYFSYPVIIEESSEDDRTLLVKVFAVPRDSVRTVKDFIYDLQDEEGVGSGLLLLPMVKTLEVTHQHYPEQMIAHLAAELLNRYVLKSEKVASVQTETSMETFISSILDVKSMESEVTVNSHAWLEYLEGHLGKEAVVANWVGEEVLSVDMEAEEQFLLAA